MISYEALKVAQHNGSPLPAAVMFSMDCQKMLEEQQDGYDPETGEPLFDEEALFERDTARGRYSKAIYRLENGTKCTLAEAAAELELSTSRTAHLFNAHCNRYTIIYKNFGKNSKIQKFRNAKGEPVSQKELSKIYNCSISTVSRYFKDHNGDHQAANKGLQQSAIKREQKNEEARTA